MSVRVGVLGDGPVAMAAALMAASLGHQITWCTLHAEPVVHDLPVYALSPTSVTALQSWGLVLPPMGRMGTMEIHDACSLGRIRLDAAALGLPALAWMLDHRTLVAALHAACRQHAHITQHVGPWSHWKAHPEAVVLHQQSAQAQRTVDTLWVATGALSRHETHQRPYGHAVWSALVRMPLAPQEHAWQIFEGERVVACLPGCAPGTAALLWYAPPEDTVFFEHVTDQERATWLATHTHGAITEHEIATPWHRQVLVERWRDVCVQGRVVFLGDAAHSLHPLAGQGLNLALKELSLLAARCRLWSETPTPKDWVRALRSYALEQRVLAASVRSGLRGVKAGFAHPGAQGATLRSWGMTALDQCVGAQRVVVSWAQDLGHML